MKILVTGGAGFIGSHIVKRYLNAGHEVVILDDLSSGTLANVPEGARFYELSIQSLELADIIAKEKPELVNHHAAQINVQASIANPSRDAQINIIGTLNLLEAARKHGLKKFIFASTGIIYGDQISFPADESQAESPLSPYGAAKLAIEKYLHVYEKTYGIASVILRYANVYGPRQNAEGEAGVVAIFCEQLLKEEVPVIYGEGTQTRDYVYVDDVAACNLTAIDKGVSGIYNVGTGVETDVNSIAEQLIELFGFDVAPKYAPARLGEQKRACLKPGALQTSPPTPLGKGLLDTTAWFREQLADWSTMT